MKVVINESQLLRLFEANTLVDNLNNLIDPKKFIYEFGYGDTFILPSSVMIEGDIQDEDISVRVEIGKVIYMLKNNVCIVIANKFRIKMMSVYE